MSLLRKRSRRLSYTESWCWKRSSITRSSTPTSLRLAQSVRIFLTAILRGVVPYYVLVCLWSFSIHCMWTCLLINAWPGKRVKDSSKSTPIHEKKTHTYTHTHIYILCLMIYYITCLMEDGVGGGEQREQWIAIAEKDLAQFTLSLRDEAKHVLLSISYNSLTQSCVDLSTFTQAFRHTENTMSISGRT